MSSSMKAFVSAENMIHTTEVVRQQLKKFEGQEERIQYITEERDRFRQDCSDLAARNSRQLSNIRELQGKEASLNGEINLLNGALENRYDHDYETAEEPKRFSFKRVLGVTAILAPYALIGSYIVSLYV